MPEVGEGQRVGELRGRGRGAEDGDIVVVSQKIVSKAEGRTRRLADVEPGERALDLAARLGKDPAVVQLVLDESTTVVRAANGVLITETAGGWICANAGIDASNVSRDGTVTLLPLDADASARRIRSEVRAACGSAPAVVVSDSFGRPWRLGQTDVAIGCAGIDASRRLAGTHGPGGPRADGDRRRARRPARRGRRPRARQGLGRPCGPDQRPG